ncbi:hypothetical protein NMG60_11012616 [Bertholletia excelsa]
MLSASDAGRIGRLVLPKKCAEAYFPPISQPEGLPLKVQDSKGKEWTFQFRFWPNNNSRMYVLEGVTPCIQSMQLQAGDIVTFSRIEPEGKLIMGFRKASIIPPSNQGSETASVSNGVSINGEISGKKPKSGEVLSTHQLKVNSVPSGLSSVGQANSADQDDKSGHTAKVVLGAFRKRKNSTLGLKSKRLRIENEDQIELQLTWEQAQGLLRPPPNCSPSVVVIEGLEFEEYGQDAPIIGRPTIFTTDCTSENIQWAQCEDCFKWRKVPADACLPSRWTCAGNSWDPERSLCSVAQELGSEQLEDLLSTSNWAASKKMKAAKNDPDSVEALEGLDALANLAIQEEGESLEGSSQATTKHPRHRPGCSCIVCIQPPSGKGPKHKQTCTCNVCLTVKRRFKTLMLRREKKLSEKEAETARQKLQQHLHTADDNIQSCINAGNNSPKQKVAVNEDSDGDSNKTKASFSFKGQIDLNIQPERDEELSPRSDSGGAMRFLRDATEGYLKQLRPPNTNDSDSANNQAQRCGNEAGLNLRNGVDLSSSRNEASAEHALTLSTSAPASTSARDR